MRVGKELKALIEFVFIYPSDTRSSLTYKKNTVAVFRERSSLRRQLLLDIGAVRAYEHRNAFY
jgi:hypothetical protein